MDNYQKTVINNKNIYYSGNLGLLEGKKIGFFASRDMPLSQYPEAEKLIIEIMDMDFCFTGGWLSPFENRILKLLCSRGKNFILFSSKGIKNQTLFSCIHKPFNEGKALLLSLLEDESEVTSKNSILRNNFILDVAENNLFAFVKKGGNLERLLDKSISKGKSPLILDTSRKIHPVKKGIAINMDNYIKILKRN